MTYKIEFQPSGLRGEAGGGGSVLDAARALGEAIEAVCGGLKVCGKCRVKPLEGEFSPVGDAELRFLGPSELADGIRLACEAVPLSDSKVFVPEESRSNRQVVLEGDPTRAFPVEPSIKNYYVELKMPSASGPAADAERVRAALMSQHGLDDLSISYPALVSLHGALRDGGWKLTATVRQDKEVIRFTPGLKVCSFGAAFDVGTTTLAGCLCNLTTGETLSTSAMSNPQVAMGEDVISRISYATARSDGAAEMQSAVVGALNRMLLSMVADGQGADRPSDVTDIDEVVLAGNTVMGHILMGLPLDAIGVSPFVPAVSGLMEFPAGKIGIGVSPAAHAVMLPVVGGFVGSDTSAVMAAVGPFPKDETVLVVDLGTNGELVLSSGGRTLAASCATGPAFEGAQITSGMRAAAGAIERVVVDPDTWDVSYKVVGKDRWSVPGMHTGARGICGSGTVELVARLRLAEVIEGNGAFEGWMEHPRLRRSGNGEMEFVVAWPGETATAKAISFTQSDVRAVQLAKAAIRAGVDILMAEMGVGSIDRVVLAGAFGNYLEPWSATAVGMLPLKDKDKVVSAGNAAGDGARAALVSLSRRAEAVRFAGEAEYVELSTHPEFQGRFLAAMSIP